MTLKLLTSSASPFGRKVNVVAIETGLIDRIELVMLSTAPSAPNDGLARENPLIKIPTLVADGRSIYDSLVICDYLDTLRTGGERLIPASGPRRWDILTLHALGSGMCDAAILWRYETALRPEERRWPDWIEGQKRKIHGGLDWLESHTAALGKAGAANVDLGQIAVGCALGYLDFRFAVENWRTAHPRLAGWFGEFAERASMQRTVPSA